MNGWQLAGVLALLLASHWAAYEHGRSVELSKAGQNLAERDSRERLAEVFGERSARQEEHRIADVQQEARVKAHEEQTNADVGAAGADAAGKRLRSEAIKLSATVSCSGSDPSAIARGATATRAAMVLSDLLARADQRAGELAKAYDQARLAGLTCETSYNALIK